MASSIADGLRSLRLSHVLAAVALSWAGLANAEPVAGDYFVHSLPGAPEGPLVKMHAGHIEVTPEHNGNIFFWHFQNKHIANRQRTVIWLNGGPGCSSEDGALMEIGPYRLKDKDTLTYNEGSWNEFANVMFVDNPVGTGFSYVDTDSYLHELDEMADQFIKFLEKWFELFPEYVHDDLYLAGESYAGQHIPYIAKHILERNKRPTSKFKWELKGLLIGNGWISPPEQYEAYLDFAYEKGLIKKGDANSNQLEVQRRICNKDLSAGGERIDTQSCEHILSELLRLTATDDGPDDKKLCYNMYDVRLKDVHPSCGMNWPPDLVSVTPYLRRADVVKALHVNPNKVTGWQECNGLVSTQFRAANSTPSIGFLPDLVAQVPVLLFSGAEDLICNHLGTEAFLSKMQWNGGKGFELSPGNWAPRRDWTFEGEDAGFWQEARNLTYVLFHNASHMVPFDYPRRSRDMLDRFMGVDISSIGGAPTDSRLDGERGPETTVGGAAGHGNGTAAQQQQEKARLDAAKWAAYRRSGELVLVIVAVLAAAWGWFVWRGRRRRAGYRGLAAGELPSESSLGLEGFRNKRRGGGGGGGGGGLLAGGSRRAGDVEAGDFDESELDDLHVATPTEERGGGRYSVGVDSEDDEDEDEVVRGKDTGKKSEK